MTSRNEFLPLLAMVAVQVGYAGMNITSKVAMDAGMPPLVLVAYRQLFATVAILPFAYFLERNTRPKITKQVLFQIFFSALFGATLNQVFYFLGLEKSTATISCALTNMLPAMTFIFAIPFGLEKVGMKSKGGQAKIWGTVVCVGGAMLLSFYHGRQINIPQPNFHLTLVDHAKDHTNNHHSSLLGPFFVFLANVAMAIWFILQAKMSQSFQAPYTSSALLCFMASIQSVIIAAVYNHKVSDWSLTSRMRLVSSIYAGIVGSAMAFVLMSWTIQKKGPLYVSVFSPLLLVIVALMSWALRMEYLFVGTAIGSVLIVVGLYAVLWGKSREVSKEMIGGSHKTGGNGALGQGNENEIEINDLEKQQQVVIIKDGQQQLVVLKEIPNNQ